MIFSPRKTRARRVDNTTSVTSRYQIMTPASALVASLGKRHGRLLMAFTLSSFMAFQAVPGCPAMAAQSGQSESKSNKSKKVEPAGTLLLPLTPKLDSNHVKPASPESHLRMNSRLEYDIDPVNIKESGPAALKEPLKEENAEESALKPAPEKISPEEGKIDESSLTINEDTTLKGTIQIVADDTEYDQEKNTFLGTGNAVAIIAGQNSKLEADMILYDQNSETIDARGKVRIIRNGQLTTGSAFKFKVTSDEYLITDPDTEVQGTQVVARNAFGTKSGLAFKQGTLTLDKPFYFGKNQFNGPISYMQEMSEKKAHPDAYISDKGSFKFTARKMVYERHKERGNLTIFGGRMMFGKLGIPLPKFTATVGKQNEVTFPVTPYIGNNLLTGGTNLGPNFHSAIGKYGQLSWAPLLQLGGRRLDGRATTTGGIGMGAQVGFTGRKLQAHLAYGSNTNLLVGDLKYRIYKNFRLQSGINRFLDDGMFGYRRARLLAEVVDDHKVGGIPFITGINFRTSLGWAQDNPQLINLTPGYADLFQQKATTKFTSAFRLQEHISAATHPIFKIGTDKWGMSSNLSGGLAMRAYSTGESQLMAQVGPNLELALDRIKGRVGYTQSAVRGKSPFVFDQFIQGQRSCYVAGDVRINKYLTVGGSMGYNLVDKLAYSKTLTAAIGPQDFKVLLSRDFLRGINRFGFDVLYGQPIPFNRLVLKGSPDHGQLGGI